jgi:hypothetical protein
MPRTNVRHPQRVPDVRRWFVRAVACCAGSRSPATATLRSCAVARSPTAHEHERLICALDRGAAASGSFSGMLCGR